MILYIKIGVKKFMHGTTIVVNGPIVAQEKG